MNARSPYPSNKKRAFGSIQWFFWLILAFSVGMWITRLSAHSKMIAQQDPPNYLANANANANHMDTFTFTFTSFRPNLEKSFQSLQINLDQKLQLHDKLLLKTQQALVKQLEDIVKTQNDQKQHYLETSSLLSHTNSRLRRQAKATNHTEPKSSARLETLLLRQKLEHLEKQQNMQLDIIRQQISKLQPQQHPQVSQVTTTDKSQTNPKAPPVNLLPPVFKFNEQDTDVSGYWPNKPPSQIFPNFHSCQVVFQDPNMAACHLGAFGGNFGDMMGPDIVKRAVEYYFGCSAEHLRVHDFANEDISFEGICLWNVGSVWRFVKANDHVFGTGMLGNEELGEFTNVTVYSVRGPKTVERLQEIAEGKLAVVDAFGGGITTDIGQLQPAGDAGFLIPFLFPEYSYSPKPSITRENCVILHKYDEETFVNGSLVDDNTTLLPVVQSWQTMAGNMTTCHYIFSSSLHGLILADAFGISARWIRRSGSIMKWKFEDYFKSVGNNGNKKKFVRLIDVLMQPHTLPLPDILSHEDRSEYARRIMSRFPFQLFTTTTKATTE